MSLPHVLGLGAGLIGAAGGTWVGVKAGTALERGLSADERAAVDDTLSTLGPAARIATGSDIGRVAEIGSTSANRPGKGEADDAA